MIITEQQRPRRVAWLVALLVVAIGVASHDATAGEPNRAEVLFQKARDLMGVNDFAKACPMLEESYSLDHGAGTLLALALCHEGAGRPATALREYRETLSQAVAANRPDRVMLAESHVQKLEAAVPRIAVHVASPEPSGLELTLDGAPLDRAAIIAGAPVDPGKHEIVATAPGATPWRTTVDVLASSRSVVVDVPAWTSAAVPPHRSVSSARANWPRTLGIVVGALGIVSLGVGTYYGVAAFHAEDDSKKLCPGNVCTSQDGVRFNHDARHDAVASDVAITVGAVAVAAGLALIIRYSLKPKHVAASSARVSLGERGIATSW